MGFGVGYSSDIAHYGNSHFHIERGIMHNSADKAKERLANLKWKDAPKAMLVKAALQETVDAGAGGAGFTLAAEIDRLKQDVAAKDAALEVLIKDFAKANNLVVELKRQLAEAGK